MGLLIQNNQIILSDAAGNQRFTTEKRMPHLMLPASGTINVANCQGISTYVQGQGYAGEPYASWSGTQVNFTQDFVVLNHPSIQSENSFILPFYQITGGMVDTGGGAVTGSGSIMLRIFVDGVGYYRGVSVLTPIVSGNSVILRIKTTISDSAGTLVDHTPIPLGGNLVVGQPAPVQLANSNYTIGYRLYYGRFS